VLSVPLAFLDEPWKLSMGVRTLDIRHWLVLDDRLEEEIRERRRLSHHCRNLVYDMLPAAEPACRELLALAVDWLCGQAADRFERIGDGLRVRMTGEVVRLAAPDPLLALGCLVQEDLLLLELGPDGSYFLSAGHLCFPLDWKLADKIGRTVVDIHDPVQGFGERLASPLQRLFQNLEPERPVWRANWTLTSTPELCRPDRSDHLAHLDGDRVGRSLWLRVERQTLRRLPRTRAVLFTVKTYVNPLEEVARGPGTAATLAARLREMSDAMAAYKGLAAIREPALRWLDARAVGAQEFAT
jgi:hypothetical protein